VEWGDDGKSVDRKEIGNGKESSTRKEEGKVNLEKTMNSLIHLKLLCNKNHKEIRIDVCERKEKRKKLNSKKKKNGWDTRTAQ